MNSPKMLAAEKKIVILYSGGLDSRIMKRWAEVHYPVAEVKLVHFDIGQPYNEKEFKALPPEVEFRKVDWLRSEADLKGKGNSTGNIYIPGRNLTLACLAASIYTPDEIWLGALQGEMHDKATDKNMAFLHRLNMTLDYVFSPFGKVTVKFPLGEAGLTKLTATEWFLANGGTPEDIVKTSSCLSGEPGNCGACHVCVRRWGIATQLGYVDKEQFNVHPMRDPRNSDMIIEMLKGEKSYYDCDRRKEVVPAILQYYADGNPGKIVTVQEIIEHQELIKKLENA